MMTFTVPARPPFRLDLTVWALRRRTDSATDRWDGRVYRRILALHGGPLEIEVIQIAPPDRAQLQVTTLPHAIRSPGQRHRLPADHADARYPAAQQTSGKVWPSRVRGRWTDACLPTAVRSGRGRSRRPAERWLGLPGSLDYAGVQQALAPWQSYAGFVYLHLLVDHLAAAGHVVP